MPSSNTIAKSKRSRSRKSKRASPKGSRINNSKVTTRSASAHTQSTTLSSNEPRTTALDRVYNTQFRFDQKSKKWYPIKQTRSRTRARALKARAAQKNLELADASGGQQ